LKVYYVTYPSEKPWCSDFTAENLANHSTNNVSPATPRQVNGVRDSIIHFHNVQILGRRLRPILYMNHLHKNGNKVIVGLRGEHGKHRYDKILWKADAIATGVDPSLSEYAHSFNEHVYVLPPGEDPTLFKPLTVKNDAVLSWVGRDHKQFKHAEHLPRLGFSYKVATYNQYIPHHDLPAFYNSTRICVGFSDYEGFWRPGLEAALCGLPVIATDVGAVPNLVDKDYVIPVPAKDHLNIYMQHIQTFLEDPELAAEVGRRNRIRAHRYSWQNVAPLYDKAWGELC